MCANAPFGRGAVVRTWQTPNGAAAALDCSHPLAKPLRRLLLGIENSYPLSPLVRRYSRPKPPPPKPWRGDVHALFGDSIPTSILATIGAQGWTFEALCCAVSAHDRVVVKKAMSRLEKEAVVVGGRPRRPGFNVRVVTISDAFPAAAELRALLRAYVRVWPTMRLRTQDAMSRLHPRTKAHLRRRGLIKDA